MALSLEIMEYKASASAEVGTTTTNIKITGHGLSAGDRIINTDRLEYSFLASPREVNAVVDANNFTVTAVTSQTNGDTIKTFYFVDRVSYLRTNTLRITRKNNNQNSCEFTLVTDENTYSPKKGQQVRIKDGATTYFSGIIKTIKKKRTSNIGTANTTKMNMTCTCEGYNNIPSRRTIILDQVDTDAGTIVELMVDNFLYQEGITAGTIDTGATIAEYPDVDVESISIKQVLDDMAKTSGFKWYINDSKQLYFIQDESSISESTQDIIDGGAFTDYFNIDVEDTLVDYRNKQTIIGGIDDFGDIIDMASTNYDELDARQLIEGGSGVYGIINSVPDSTDTTQELAEAGTDTNTLVITSHGLSVGDAIYNVTRNAEGQVKSVTNANEVELEIAITGQTTGDTIRWYPDINTVLLNNIKKWSVAPRKLQFDSFTLNWQVTQRVDVELASYDIASGSKFLIEEVIFSDFNGNTLKATVKATERDSTNWSSQAGNTWTTYFDEMISNTGNTKTVGGSNPRIFVSTSEPTPTGGLLDGDVWIVRPST